MKNECEEDLSESFPKPKTHHIITCKKCNKRSKVSVKYTRLCTICRSNDTNKNAKVCLWDSWDGVP